MLSHHKKTLESYLSSVFSFFVMLAEVSASLFPSGNVFAEGSASRSRAESHLRNLPQTYHFLIFSLRIMFSSMC